MDEELTVAETERLDYIQGLTHEFIANLIPDEKRRQEMLESCDYDFDAIDAVLLTVWEHIKDRLMCSEREFYPLRDSNDRNRDDRNEDEDLSIDCCDFYWADLALAEDHPKCCEMCGNFDEKTRKCMLA